MPGDQQQQNKQQGKEEEEEECGWCKFMKAGPCRTVFEVRGHRHLPCQAALTSFPAGSAATPAAATHSGHAAASSTAAQLVVGAVKLCLSWI